ncbi:MAG TPA: DUF2484 family protein [Rhodobacterales bacterium]|nr:DUF2484 family protein [Rhodobacterales bacterium]
MTPSLIAAALWVLAGALISPLPIRLQILPGSLLLLTALPLIVWLGVQNGWLWTALGLAAFLSMFRRPLLHLLARARRRQPPPPSPPPPP